MTFQLFQRSHPQIAERLVWEAGLVHKRKVRAYSDTYWKAFVTQNETKTLLQFSY